jgi:hypothetical protein
MTFEKKLNFFRLQKVKLAPKVLQLFHTSYLLVNRQKRIRAEERHCSPVIA